MRFLVDESTGKRLNELLKNSGLDTIFAGDVMRGSTDQTILLKAKK